MPCYSRQTMHSPNPAPIPVEILLLAYRSGIFPMADRRDDPDVFWVEPRERAIIPLDRLHLSRSLLKAIRQDRFEVTIDRDFPAVIAACSQPRSGHPESWISQRIITSYCQLHRAGHAHSLECWRDGELVGGLYGVAFDRVFCGESMFSRERDASKVALAWLVALMRHGGYLLLDCQFITDHLATLGAVEMRQADYLGKLAAARGEPRLTLPAAYSSLVGVGEGTGAGLAAGNGAGVGVADSAACAAGAEVGEGRGAGPSSPGKLIAQSLTQTS